MTCQNSNLNYYDYDDHDRGLTMSMRMRRSATFSDAHILFNELRNSIYKKSWDVVWHILTPIVDHQNNVAATSTTGTTGTSTASTCTCTFNTSSNTVVHRHRTSSSMCSHERDSDNKPYNYFTVNGIDIEDQIDLLRHLLLSPESDDDDDDDDDDDSFRATSTDGSVGGTVTGTGTSRTLPKPSCLQDIIGILIQALDVSSYLPAACASASASSLVGRSRNFDDDIFNFNGPIPIVSAPEPQGTSLLIELCMDSNHFGVQQLLQALPPTVASVEVQRSDYVYVEYMEQEQLQHLPQEDAISLSLLSSTTSTPTPLSSSLSSSSSSSTTTSTAGKKISTCIKDFHFFHTPLQAAWEGILYHSDEKRRIMPFIQNMNDLFEVPSSFLNDERSTTNDHKDIQNLWRTTLHLLRAVDTDTDTIPSTPLSLSPSMSSSRLPKSDSLPSLCPSWNIIHTIIRLGHKAHSAVLWFALRLYEKSLLAVEDSNGDLPIHSAATNLIHYKSVRAHLFPEKTLRNYDDTADASRNKRKRKYDSCFQSDQQDKHRPRRDAICNKKSTHSTLFRHGGTNWDQPPIIHLLQYEEGRRTASVRDRKGRLPLHLLLANHDENQAQLERIHTFYDQNLGDDTIDDDDDCNDEQNTIAISNKKGYTMDSAVVVRELVNAYPDSVHCVDPTNGLYPFLAAATSKTMPLDVIYFLLSHNLDILSSCCTSSGKVKHFDHKQKRSIIDDNNTTKKQSRQN